MGGCQEMEQTVSENLINKCVILVSSGNILINYRKLKFLQSSEDF